MHTAEVKLVNANNTKGGRTFDLLVSSDGGKTWATLPTASGRGSHKLMRGKNGEMPVAQVPVALLPREHETVKPL